MKGQRRLINGDMWTVVDVAPAAPLAEMVAGILEEEGLVVMTRGVDWVDDAFSHLGAGSVGTTAVLVPEADAERALALIADTVTDYQGEDLERLLSGVGEGAGPEELAELLGYEYDQHADGDDEDPGDDD